MSLFRYIIQDFRANKHNVKGQIVMILFRMAQLCRRSPKLIFYICIPYLIFYRLMVEWVLCIELPWNLTVGEGLRLYHGQALVVNDRATIGKGCVLRHSTTIGVASTNEDFLGDAPSIGDYVDIGSNVVILGGVTIGDGAIIGAGSVVVKDVKTGAVVVGNPAHEIRLTRSSEQTGANDCEK